MRQITDTNNNILKIKIKNVNIIVIILIIAKLTTFCQFSLPLNN